MTKINIANLDTNEIKFFKPEIKNTSFDSRIFVCVKIDNNIVAEVIITHMIKFAKQNELTLNSLSVYIGDEVRFLFLNKK